MRVLLPHGPLVLGALLLSLLLAALSVTHYRTVTAKLQHVGSQFEAVSAVRAEQAMQLERLRVLNTEREAADWLHERLSAPNSQSELLLALNNVVLRSGVMIDKDDFLSESIAQGIEAFRHSLRITGSYAAIKHFLAEIYSMPGITFVSMVALEPVPRSEQVRAHIELAVYHAPLR